MFEFFVAKKYLIPNKKQLSSSLIALVSVVVISLVVFLLLLFLSVTEGMEKTWLKKLTSLNAPIKITPTNFYKNSYYNLIDTISSSSNFTTKSLKEKLTSEISDPYNLEQDPSVPNFWPPADRASDGSLKDPVKIAFSIFEKMKEKDPSFIADDFEATGVLIKLKLVRPATVNAANSYEQSFLSQMCYAASFSEKSPFLHSLLQEPCKEDIQHLIYLSSLSQEEITLDGASSVAVAQVPLHKKRLKDLFSFIPSAWALLYKDKVRLDSSCFLDNAKFYVLAHFEGGLPSSIIIPTSSKQSNSPYFHPGIMEKKDGKLYFKKKGASQVFDICASRIYFNEDQRCSVSLDPQDLTTNASLKFSTTIQHQPICGSVSPKALRLETVEVLKEFSKTPLKTPLWPFFINKQGYLPSSEGKDHPVILPKNFKDNGVLVGDKGFMSFGAASPTSMQEQRLSIYVAGFYDPGVLSVGNRCVLLSKDIVHDISLASENFSFDESLSAGIQVWYEDIFNTKKVVKDLELQFEKHGIAQYFTITPFYEYDFAKDLAQQFQSDKYLFTLIGLVILIVACSNIVSFLILMINDKKKEIAILQSMGASPKSITMIFSMCGAILGFIGTAVGSLAAYFTLLNLNQVVQFLSLLQGQALFHEAFYGSCLPTTLSSQALIFLLITAPLLSLLAGLIPALKTTKMNPSDILRSQ
jgi:lipoprotein-releasing system permease protein